MTSTSVIPSYLPIQHPHDTPRSAYGLSTCATSYQPVEFSTPNSAMALTNGQLPVTSMSLLNSLGPLSETALHPNGATQRTPPYFTQPPGLPNGYFSPLTNFCGPEAYRFVHQPQAQMHALFQQNQSNPYRTVDSLGCSTTRSMPITASPGPHATSNSGVSCLLPVPGVAHASNIACCKMRSETGALRTNSVSEENMCGRSSQAGMTEQSMMIHTNPHTLTLIVRLLMSGKEAGSIIGKGGENVKKYREESGARINISDGSSPERIVTVTGTTEQISTAFTLMSQKFEDDFTQGLMRMGDEGLTCPPVTLRLLVHATQCGSIIGKGGSRIKDVRELTGASIQVASEALPTSTDRTVTISGTAKAIAKCIRHLCDIFIESPAKGLIIPYRPKPAMAVQPIVCSGAVSAANMLNPSVILPNCNSESSTENGFSTMGGFIPTGSSSGLLMTSSGLNQPSTDVIRSNANDSPSSTGPSISKSSSTPTPPPASGYGNEHSIAILPDFITDSMQSNYHDFTSQQLPILSAINPVHLIPNLIPNHLTAQLLQTFSWPDLTLNQSLLNQYAPQSIPGFFSNPNVLLACNPGDELINQNNNELVVKTDSSNGVVDHLNSYLANGNSRLNWSQSLSNPIPMLQNRNPIFGLPSLPVHPMFAGMSVDPSLTTYGGSLPNSEEMVVREIIISNELIGCIIGRGGSTVNEIRNVSRAQIKISNCEDGAKERKITLSGPIQAVNLANLLINNSLNQYEQNRAFNVQLAVAATAMMTSGRFFRDGGSENPCSTEITDLISGNEDDDDDQCNVSSSRSDSKDCDTSSQYIASWSLKDSSHKVARHVSSLKKHRDKCAPYSIPVSY